MRSVIDRGPWALGLLDDPELIAGDGRGRGVVGFDDLLLREGFFCEDEIIGEGELTGAFGGEKGDSGEVEGVSINPDVSMDSGIALFVFGIDLDDGWAAAKEAVFADGEVPHAAGFIPAGGIVFDENGAHVGRVKFVVGDDRFASGGDQKTTGGSAFDLAVADLDGRSPGHVFERVVQLELRRKRLGEDEDHFAGRDEFGGFDLVSTISGEGFAGHEVDVVSGVEGGEAETLFVHEADLDFGLGEGFGDFEMGAVDVDGIIVGNRRDLPFGNGGTMVVEGKSRDRDVFTTVEANFHHFAAIQGEGVFAGDLEMFGMAEKDRDCFGSVRGGVGVGDLVGLAVGVGWMEVVGAWSKFDFDGVVRCPAAAEDQRVVKGAGGKVDGVARGEAKLIERVEAAPGFGLGGAGVLVVAFGRVDEIAGLARGGFAGFELGIGGWFGLGRGEAKQEKKGENSSHDERV